MSERLASVQLSFDADPLVTSCAFARLRNDVMNCKQPRRARTAVHTSWILVIVCAAIASVMAVPAAGQDVPIGDQQPAKRGKKQEEKKKAKKQSGAKHPTFNIGDDVTIKVEARVESAVRAATPEIGLDDTSFTWGDRRVGVEGTLYKRFQFELSNELSEQFEHTTESGESGWKDAYLKARFSKAFTLGAGRFKEPFGRDQLTSESNLDFIFRSFAGRVLSPGRDVGVMAEGRLLDRG